MAKVLNRDKAEAGERLQKILSGCPRIYCLQLPNRRNTMNHFRVFGIESEDTIESARIVDIAGYVAKVCGYRWRDGKIMGNSLTPQDIATCISETLFAHRIIRAERI